MGGDLNGFVAEGTLNGVAKCRTCQRVHHWRVACLASEQFSQVRVSAAVPIPIPFLRIVHLTCPLFVLRLPLICSVIIQVQALRGEDNLTSLLSLLDSTHPECHPSRDHASFEQRDHSDEQAVQEFKPANPQDVEQAQIKQSSERPHVPGADDPQQPSAGERSSTAEDHILTPAVEKAQNGPDQPVELPHGLMMSPAMDIELNFRVKSLSNEDKDGFADPRKQMGDSQASTPPPPLFHPDGRHYMKKTCE